MPRRRWPVTTCTLPGRRGRSPSPVTPPRSGTAQETVFLALFDDGWRVTAAGCTRLAGPAEPYDCDVEGG